MKLDQWTSLEPSSFKQKLLDNCDTHEIYIVDLYNALIWKAKDNPARVTELAEAAVEVFDSLGDSDEVLLFLELHARCHLANDDIDRAMSIITRIMTLDRTAAEMVALELAQDIINCADSFGISLDQRPRVLNQVESIFQHYDRQEEIAGLYLKSAFVYSQHGASQAAYRCTSDAEQIARVLLSLPLLARCYSAAVVVACEEPDYRWAIGAGERALTAYQQAELEAPADLLSNLGVAHMNLDELEQATGYFEQALTYTDMPVGLESAIRVNLSTCLRRRNQLPQAVAMLATAEATSRIEDQPECALELALSAAKLAGAKANTPMLIQWLQVASKRLDHLLADVLRLHHRRGLRERYIVRLERLLRSLPANGTVTDALLPVVATRGNAMGDWLAILSWAAQLRQESNFPPALTSELDNILHRIRNLGAPHLYGFWEKYDDPWSGGDFGYEWDKLSQLCARIKALGLSLPLDKANSLNQAALCQTRLNQGHCLMVTTYAGDDALLWCFIGDRYQRVAIPLQPLMHWHQAQFEYANGSRNRRAFTVAIEELTQALSSLLDPVFVDIASAGCASIRYIEDSLRDLPLMLFALRNDELSARMAAGDFQVRLVPAMVESLRDNSTLSGVTSIIDYHEDLLLAPYEGHAFTRAAGLPLPASLPADSSGNLTSLISEHDVLIVSTHGHSLEFFTDAYFAKLGSPDGSHLINVSSLQEAAPDLPIRLAILNTCYSGSRSSRNYQKTFRTSDAVAIPNLFLLNRRAVALASTWKISDTASFIVAHLIGEGLKHGHEPSAAVARAITRLRSMTSSETIAILTYNLPESVQAKAILRVNGAPEQGMFSHPYFTAGLAIHGLL
ncbi:MAG: CHAT domain-containing protein [Methylicorpusculum sp.]|uniref:CHAT domain-containing tetratricopeptide repeat protein n=1 Tax=Methylicorpusculum sp. TaxID=2713644 RepID=UPI0027278068|nr:CHAT domain-containing protein [Methylicorpusculum sp.]MDZ4099170.1 CHAT domain-containing protein [Methylophilaceae bacterium]MDO8842711.1 CHAT domain-containing protein [Methylicorpusculum sp.]MDO8938576.1 CHAT domain-containing protein [Methylicorpusculum sp.]MDP2204228.1 CHAT domain-containing protein [Methylicorpusculum sp.]MDP3530754.1 CHAT domain-containing protein [Methylicorpusculum sp.]